MGTKWNNDKHKSEKLSYGVSCFKRINGQMHILMTCKRNTYAFIMFVHGVYGTHDTCDIMKLLNDMTVEEKLLILSLEFNQLWYRVYLHDETYFRQYFQLKYKYENAFVMDRGVRIKQLIAQSKHATALWEIPKGRKSSKEESDILCAVREFCEETGLNKKDFQLLSHESKKISFEDANVKYVYKYFIAVAHNSARPTIKIEDINQSSEIQHIKWMPLSEVRSCYCHKTVVEYATHAFNYAKKYIGTNSQ